MLTGRACSLALCTGAGVRGKKAVAAGFRYSSNCVRAASLLNPTVGPRRRAPHYRRNLLAEERFMSFDDLRVFMAILRPPIAVPVLILLIGVNAASWMVVLDRVGITRTLAWLMLVPPLFLLPA